jgi:hypothetical protein
LAFLPAAILFPDEIPPFAAEGLFRAFATVLTEQDRQGHLHFWVVSSRQLAAGMPASNLKPAETGLLSPSTFS